MSNAGSYGRAPGLSARRRSSHTIAPTRSSSSVKAPNFCCDSCLWSDLPKTTEAVYSCVTCLHCYCVSCLRNLAKPSRSKGEAGNVLWFRCPVPMCAIMIQANSQVREVNGKNLPIQLQYLHKSQQTSRGISVMQKTLRFKLDNLKGRIKIQTIELARLARVEQKLAEVTKKYSDLKIAYHKLKLRSTNKQEDTSLTANYESRRVERHIDHTPSGSVHSKGMAPGLSFLEEPSTTPKVDRTLMF